MLWSVKRQATTKETAHIHEAIKREDLFFASRRILAHVNVQRKANEKSPSHATRKNFLDSYVFNSHLDEAHALGATSDFLSIDFYFFPFEFRRRRDR